MKKQHRRQFIAAASILAVSPAIMCTTPPPQAEKKQVIHHVFFWLKQAGNAADKQALLEGVQSLKAIKEIKQLFIGTAAPTEQRDVVDSSYDVSELLFFDTVADQKIYQDHPVHKAFVEKYSPLWQKVIVYDMLTV